MSDSRGNAISAYSPAFAKGAQVYGTNIAADAVTSAHIAAGTVVAADVKDGAITSAKLGSKAVVASKMNAAQITGTVISAGITYAVAHGLGAIPSIVQVGLRSSMALISAGGANIGESSASARTSANFYITAEQHGIGFAAYAQI